MEFLMTIVSQDLGLTSHPKDTISDNTVCLSLHWVIEVYLKAENLLFIHM
uniref:Uncharacterized protein n=1 Tax=Anguilla anguilla TaxID=7936 RepID=A0A0E9WEI7_ANGAN